MNKQVHLIIKMKFIIPVYENMPSTPSAKPTGTGKIR